MVSQPTTRFESGFLEAKQRQLRELKALLQGTRAVATAEEGQVNAAAGGAAREYEEEAQRLTTLELEGTLELRDTQRLANVERALRKIEEGTYGLSDLTGEPIPLERLNATPDALYTLDEQEAFDQKH
jgi:DnaK suppressor protein